MSPRSRRDEAGAIAVLAAMVSLVLFLIAGLVVDLGLARDVKRQSQASSDAGALAAASALFVNSTAPDFVAAGAAAKNYAAMNFGVTASDWSTCSDPGALTYKPAGTACISFDSATKPTVARVLTPIRKVDTGFGRAAGVTTIPISSVAEASTLPPAPDYLRPWGLCSDQVPQATGSVTLIVMPGNGHTSAHGCSESNAGGNWWLMLCPGDQNGNTNQTADNIKFGCQSTITPVQGQSTRTGDLADYLIAACASTGSSCLAGDTGRNLHLFADEWQALVGQTITMPVFCDEEPCSKSTVTGSGSNAKYPLYKMVSVHICGFGLSGRYSTGWPAAPDLCANRPAGLTPQSAFSNREDGFLVVFETIDKPIVTRDESATTSLMR